MISCPAVKHHNSQDNLVILLSFPCDELENNLQVIKFIYDANVKQTFFDIVASIHPERSLSIQTIKKTISFIFSGM